MNTKSHNAFAVPDQLLVYIKDTNDKKKWIVDEEAAEVVKRIFAICVAGKGPTKIAKILQSENVLTVKSHYAEQKNLALPDNPYRWNENSVVGILGRMEYCGHTVAFKTYSKSNKLKKRIETPKEQQLIFRDTHEAIIDEAVWDGFKTSEKTGADQPKQSDKVFSLV